MSQFCRSDRSPASSMITTLPPTSPYYTTSAVRAQFLLDISSIQQNSQVEEIEADSAELGRKKAELTESLSRKLDILREEQEAIQQEREENEELGHQVTEMAKSVCKANEFNKYQLFVDELEKIINLLLSLSRRRAKAENALNHLDPDCDPEQKAKLKEKCEMLQGRYEDAKKLKENIDKRCKQVSETLKGYLDEEDYQNYEYFVTMKSQLTMQAREIDDKIKLGEEQLVLLNDSSAGDPLSQTI